MTLAQFITRYDGKKVGSGQCVALARAWIKNLTGDQFYGIPNVVDAKDFWTKADPHKWEKHSARSKYVPKRNSLIVFSGRPGQEHGHVAIVRDGNTLHDTYTFDQNWSHKLRCAKERHPRDHRTIGFLVKKKGT